MLSVARNTRSVKQINMQSREASSPQSALTDTPIHGVDRSKCRLGRRNDETRRLISFHLQKTRGELEAWSIRYLMGTPMKDFSGRRLRSRIHAGSRLAVQKGRGKLVHSGEEYA